MKKTIFLLVLLSSGVLYSQTYYINVWSNGKATSIPIQDIQKLTFANLDNVENAEEVTTVIKAFKLLQNYPNPFNPDTKIEYQIPEQGSVTVNIFSINGQLVKTFENTHASSGAYIVTWDGTNNEGLSVASGLYIYRVKYANSVVAKKMLFVK